MNEFYNKITLFKILVYNSVLLTRKLMIAPVFEIQFGKEINEFSCKRLID